MKILDVDRHEFRVIGSCRGADLKSAVLGTLAEQERVQESERQQLARTRLYTKRRIGHPLFKNGTLDQVLIQMMLFPAVCVTFHEPPRVSPRR